LEYDSDSGSRIALFHGRLYVLHLGSFSEATETEK
jgi:hypothetical protein